MEPINVGDYELLAEQRLAPAVWDYYTSGTDDEVTLRANRAAFARIQLRPRGLGDVSGCAPATAVLGTPVRMPIMIAPAAMHGYARAVVHSPSARATGEAGTLMVSSTSEGVG